MSAYSRKCHPNGTLTSTGAGYHHTVECMLVGHGWMIYCARDTPGPHALGQSRTLCTVWELNLKLRKNLYDDVFEQVQISECHNVLHGLI